MWFSFKIRINENVSAIKSYDEFVVFLGDVAASPCGLTFGSGGLYFTDWHGEKDGLGRVSGGNIYRVRPNEEYPTETFKKLVLHYNQQVHLTKEVKHTTDFRKQLLDGGVSERLIKKMHTIIMRNLSVSSSEYRRIQVYIEKAEYVPPPPFEIPQLMQELITWYRANKRKLHPLELGVLLHTKFVTIHPFTDGNGRVGRALLDFVLQQNGYPTLVLDLGHREKYLDAVEEGNKEHYKPIVDFLYEIYLAQHCTIINETIARIRSGEAKAFPEHKRVVEEFSKIREESEKG